jgi:hypothetical protein
MVDEARVTLERVRAKAWLEQLEGALGGASTVPAGADAAGRPTRGASPTLVDQIGTSSKQ